MNVIKIDNPKTANDLQADLFRLLAHPARLAILNILRSGEECVCHMEATLGYRQSYLSQQLALLRNANIVQVRRDGWNIFYKVIRPEIYPVIDAADLLNGKTPLSNQGHQFIDDCPCPKCEGRSDKP